MITKKIKIVLLCISSLLFISICLNFYQFFRKKEVDIGKGHYYYSYRLPYNLEIYENNSIKIYSNKMLLEGTLTHEGEDYFIETTNKKYLVQTYEDKVIVSIDTDNLIIPLVFSKISNVPTENESIK